MPQDALLSLEDAVSPASRVRAMLALLRVFTTESRGLVQALWPEPTLTTRTDVTDAMYVVVNATEALINATVDLSVKLHGADETPAADEAEQRQATPGGLMKHEPPHTRPHVHMSTVTGADIPTATQADSPTDAQADSPTDAQARAATQLAAANILGRAALLAAYVVHNTAKPNAEKTMSLLNDLGAIYADLYKPGSDVDGLLEACKVMVSSLSRDLR